MKTTLPAAALALLLFGSCLRPDASAAAPASAPSSAAAAVDQQGRGQSPPPVIGQTPPAPAPAPAGPYRPKREPQFHFEPGGPVADAQLAGYHVALSCSVGGEDAGTMTVALWPQFAPRTVRNFLRYCDEGFYDGLSFHRILREFMLQGGDPSGTGGGDGPYGQIPGEFSGDPARAHHYGVLSMARETQPDSASCQFFIICAETASVWNLDGKYASFGTVVDGVATLEAVANAPTDPRSREGAKPLQPVLITRAEVIEGPAPAPERPLERPAPDLGGEPAVIEIQHILISFAGTGTEATRTKEEAFELAQVVHARALAGEDFTALLREHSDDPIQPGDPLPGLYRLTNRGVSDPVFERAIFQAERAFTARDQELSALVGQGKLSFQQKTKEMEKHKEELIAKLPRRSFPRQQMVPAFGDIGFKLQVGEIGLAEYNPITSKFGWHIIKRIQ